MTNTDKIHVLLVEDDADLCSALSEYLDLNGCQVTAVGSGLAFYQALANSGLTFQVAVIDLGLPDQPGHVLAEYARHNTNMSIIIVTANDSVDNRIETYSTGADLFLGKPIDSRELLSAVAAMSRRYYERIGNDLNTNENIGAAWRLDMAHRNLFAPNGEKIVLSPHETTTCELFCNAGTNIVSRIQFLERLYGRDDESTQRALDNMIRRLRQKIAAGSNLPDPILTAYGSGYSFSEPLRLQ